MKLFVADQDKANHYLYGSLLALLVVVVSSLAGWPKAAPFLGAVSSTILGVLTEVFQYFKNQRQEKLGLPAQNSVESMDAVATSAGGVVLGMAVYFSQILS